MLTADRSDSLVLILSDLSAAFDTVDHDIPLHHFETWAGLKGAALSLLHSYLSNRMFSVSLGNFLMAQLSCGVPQGCVLGPLIFSIYMLPFGHVS